MRCDSVCDCKPTMKHKLNLKCVIIITTIQAILGFVVIVLMVHTAVGLRKTSLLHEQIKYNATLAQKQCKDMFSRLVFYYKYAVL